MSCRSVSVGFIRENELSMVAQELPSPLSDDLV